MKLVAIPITQFSSLKEFVSAFLDIIKAHKHLFENGFLHCDICPNNMMICKSPSSVTTTGLLTDFDFTIRPSHHHLQTIQGGVTPIGIMRESSFPFMSLRVLESKLHDTAKFQLADDLQAMFFVFIWTCILHTGPCGQIRAFRATARNFLAYEWSKLGAGSLSYGKDYRIHLSPASASISKRIFIYTSMGDGMIDDQFTRYFDALKPVAKKWRRLFSIDRFIRLERMPPAAVGQPMLESALTHDAITGILSHTLDLLPDTSSLKRGRKYTSIDVDHPNPKRRRKSIS